VDVRRLPAVMLAAALTVVLSACDGSSGTTSASDPSRPATSSQPSSSSAASPGAPGGEQGSGLRLADAIRQLPVRSEVREGYEREAFKHWTDEDSDGCSARQEVLLQEAVEAPVRGARCALSGGVWRSSYDGVTVSKASGLDIDHMVPLAEAWDSGASAWTADHREAYANDLGSPASLIAVTARSNRAKSDQDPAEWLPPAETTHCGYAADWVATKLRWKLTADQAEIAALTTLAGACPDTVVAYEPAG
jgi:hypothetical protein